VHAFVRSVNGISGIVLGRILFSKDVFGLWIVEDWPSGRFPMVLA
jgi:hypothetical protein